jgi:hypothetical protein
VADSRLIAAQTTPSPAGWLGGLETGTASRLRLKLRVATIPIIQTIASINNYDQRAKDPKRWGRKRNNSAACWPQFQTELEIPTPYGCNTDIPSRGRKQYTSPCHLWTRVDVDNALMSPGLGSGVVIVEAPTQRPSYIPRDRCKTGTITELPPYPSQSRV